MILQLIDIANLSHNQKTSAGNLEEKGRLATNSDGNMKSGALPLKSVPSPQTLSPAVPVKNRAELMRKLPEIYREIESQGYSIVKVWDTSEETMLDVASYFGRIQGHPKADERGLVGVTPEKVSNDPSVFERNISKTSEEFLLHTDGSFLDGIVPVEDKYFRLGPPSLFLLQCVRPAEQGGESVLLDAKEVMQALQTEQPELAVLAQTRGLLHFFGGDQMALDFPLFEKMHPSAYRLRFRWDLGLANANHAQSLRYLINQYFLGPRFQKRYRLEAGEIVIVDNSRVVHGRDAISLQGKEGPRLMRRTWIWNESSSEIEGLSGTFSGMDAFEKNRLYGPRGADLRLRSLALGIRLTPTV